MGINNYTYKRGIVTLHEVKDACSPTNAFCRFSTDKNIFFLDSALLREDISRYTFLGFDPFLTVKAKQDRITVSDKSGIHEFRGNPFEYLRKFLNLFSLNGIDDVIPFQGGAVGYFGYDLCHYIEKLPNKSFDDLGLPDMYVGFYDIVVSYDNVLEECYVVGIDFGHDDTLHKRIKSVIDTLCKKNETTPAGTFDSLQNQEINPSELSFNFTKEAYIKAISRIKKYIAAGDVYQVNLSQRIETCLNIPPYELYKRLRTTNPAPFSCYLGFEDVAVISSSPERFLKVRGKKVQTRPIKGTRPRGKDPETDEIMKRALLESSKDDAELTMITDLERNDLGRVCNYGTIKVTERKALETYPTVHHLVSTIVGELYNKYDFVDLLKAMFPGGSITGAPKIRAMQIIDELEPYQRSVYTGSIGYIGFNGDADLNIAIRTFIMKGKRVYFQVGSGIVADSVEEDEYEETLHKARALIESLNLCHMPSQ